MSLSEDELKEFPSADNHYTFLGVNCKLTPRKGIDLIIKSMPFIDDVKLIIVGNGPAQLSLQELASQVGVDDRVYFLGYKSNASRYLPYYDIFMMPSRSEGFPLALLEAAAYKKNTICSDIPIFKEIFTEKETTFFEMENVQSLVKAIKEAINTNKGEQTYNRYLKDYSPELFYQRYIEVYKG